MWQPMTPRWVTPTACEVVDLHVLACLVHAAEQSATAAGMAAAVAWVGGGRRGPVTGRDEQPVSKALAQAEQWAAVAASSAADGLPPPPLESFCASLQVAYWPPGQVSPQWAHGVRRALRWLTGAQEEPPLPVPMRSSDGHVLRAEELFAQAAAEQAAYWIPEDRAVARLQAERDAERSRQLAALIADAVQRSDASAR